mmetsp:Transcript_63778/g.152077  ORF Transcript_63778/g.152077 Transcript_63778/m.152077 type:complete len:113 (-) Transcript_63778:71-409(-)
MACRAVISAIKCCYPHHPATICLITGHAFEERLSSVVWLLFAAWRRIFRWQSFIHTGKTSVFAFSSEIVRHQRWTFFSDFAARELLTTAAKAGQGLRALAVPTPKRLLVIAT